MSNGEKQRIYVNDEFAKRTKGKSLSLKQRTKILNVLWKRAKNKYPE